MKKYLPGFLITFLFFVQGIFSEAQEMRPLPYYFSFFTGLNMCRNLNIDSVTTDRAYLPFAGLNINKDIGDNSRLAGGILYSMKGSNIVTNNRTYRLNYIDIHLYYKYKLLNFLEIYSGLQPSFLINARYKKADVKNDITAGFNHFELNIPVGIDLAIQKNVWLGFAWDIPNSMCKYENFKLSLNIRLNPDNFMVKNDSSKITAIREIREMKNGALFVRLQSGKKTAEALINAGRKNEAEIIIEGKIIENKEIIKAFRNKFNFCPVYFFYADKTDQLLMHEFSTVLLNDSLEPDTTNIIFNGPMYIGEFGVLGQNMRFQDTSAQKNNQVYYMEDFNSGISAFMIMNSGLSLLKDPFPFYMRVNEVASKRKYPEIISVLNSKLIGFYRNTINNQVY